MESSLRDLWQSQEGRSSMGPYLLVLTASVRPNRIAGLTRTDPVLREGDYAASLSAYLGLEAPSVGGILLLENSGADLGGLRRTADSVNHRGLPVEFVSFNDNGYDPLRGKGYGEYRMLDRGLAESEMAKRFDYWVKATGRYFVCNLESILRPLQRPFDLACDLKDHRLRGSRYRSFDTSLVVYGRDFYERRVRGIYEQVRECDYSPDWLENVLYRLARQAMREGEHVIPRLPAPPRIRGIAGHHGKDFDSPGMRAKWLTKSILRKTVPWLWI